MMSREIVCKGTNVCGSTIFKSKINNILNQSNFFQSLILYTQVFPSLSATDTKMTFLYITYFPINTKRLYRLNTKIS